jgi:hypothetical protein
MAFGVYIPVGPSDRDVRRVADLIDSILTYEPAVHEILLIDHGAAPRTFLNVIHKYPSTQINVLKFCVQTDHGSWLGAGCVANLVAIKHLMLHSDLDFILKLDTDALVIAPFCDMLVDRFTGERDAGIAGTRGNSCNRSARSYEYDVVSKRRFDNAVEVAKRVRHDPRELDNIHIVSWNLFSTEHRDDFMSVCDDISEAMFKGFGGEHCQGGAYAISRKFVTLAHARGLFDHPMKWLYVPINEDRMMGMYCRLLGLSLDDYSERNQVFGVQNRDLAYAPEVLIGNGYCIIHSLRAEDGSEARRRQYFGSRRSGIRETRHQSGANAEEKDSSE